MPRRGSHRKVTGGGQGFIFDPSALPDMHTLRTTPPSIIPLSASHTITLPAAAHYRSTSNQPTMTSISRTTVNIMTLAQAITGPVTAAPERQRGFQKGNRSSAGAGGAQRSRMPRRGGHRKVTGGGQGFIFDPSALPDTHTLRTPPPSIIPLSASQI